MHDDMINAQLAEIMAAVFGVDATELSDEWSTSTIGAWTSIAHLSLIAAIEEAFGIHLSVADMYAAQNVPALRQIVLRYLANPSAP